MAFVTHAFVFFGYGLFTLYLVYTGEITRFISPRLVWLTYFSGFSLGLFLLTLFLRNEHNKASNRSLLWKQTVKGVLLVYPLMLFLLIRPSDITAVNIPAVKTIPAQKTSSKKQKLFNLPIDSAGYVRLNLFELWLLARNHPELAQMHKFKVVGAISDNTSEKYLSVNRLFMTCCAADATPVEIDVVRKSEVMYNKGDWIEVSGSIIVADHVIMVPDSIKTLDKKPESYITRWSEEPPFNPE